MREKIQSWVTGYRLHATRGFTLIELLVAASIISIITGGGIASYVQFNNKEKLKAAALEVKTYLRKAQTNALAGAKSCESFPDGCGGSTTGCGDTDTDEKTLDGWCLDLFSGYLYGHCGGPVVDPPQHAWFDVKQFDLPDGAILSSFAPDGTLDVQRSVLMFKPLAQGVDQDSIICLSASSLGVSSQYKLLVTTSGEITDSGFVSSCP